MPFELSTSVGSLNLETQVEINALTQDSVEMEDKGTASDQRVVLSIIVSK